MYSVFTFSGYPVLNVITWPIGGGMVGAAVLTYLMYLFQVKVFLDGKSPCHTAGGSKEE